MADVATRGRWRSLARRAHAEATGPTPGPVHLNLAFREPLLGTAGELPPTGVATDTEADADDVGGRSAAAAFGPVGPVDDPADGWLVAVLHELVGRRGVFVAGPGSGDGPLLHLVAEGLGWPVVAAPQAAVWAVPGAVIPAADALLRSPWLAEALRPDVVVRLGLPLASKVVGEWVAASGGWEIAVAGPDRWIDPHGTVDRVLPVRPDAALGAWALAVAGVRPLAGGAWRDLWVEAGAAALEAVDRALDGREGLTEPGIVRAVTAALPAAASWSSRPRCRSATSSGSPDLGTASASTPTEVRTGSTGWSRPRSGWPSAPAGRRPCSSVTWPSCTTRTGSSAPPTVGWTWSWWSSTTTGAASSRSCRRPARWSRWCSRPSSARPMGWTSLPSRRPTAWPPRAITEDVGGAVADAVRAGGVHVLVARTRRAANAVLHGELQAAVASALDADALTRAEPVRGGVRGDVAWCACSVAERRSSRPSARPPIPPTSCAGCSKPVPTCVVSGLAHGPLETSLDRIRRIREASVAVGRPVGIMVDLPGPKVRSAPFSDDGVVLVPESAVRLTEAAAGDVSTAEVIAVALPGRSMPSPPAIGSPSATAESPSPSPAAAATPCMAVVSSGGVVRGRPGVALPEDRIALRSPTEQDLAFIEGLAGVEVDSIAVSFVQTAEDIAAVRLALGSDGPMIVAKIETGPAVTHLDDILHAADGVMVARGDLGVRLPDGGRAPHPEADHPDRA